MEQADVNKLMIEALIESLGDCTLGIQHYMRRYGTVEPREIDTGNAMRTRDDLMAHAVWKSQRIEESLPKLREATGFSSQVDILAAWAGVAEVTTILMSFGFAPYGRQGAAKMNRAVFLSATSH